MVKIPAVSVIGAIFGDEGKGKVTDAIGEKADRVVKFQGGANAGHTIVVDGKEYILHLMPAGAVRGKRSLIATDVALNPERLVEEIALFNGDVSLGIDPRTKLALPYHIALDIAEERARNKTESGAIGTTAQGIGPAYAGAKNRIEPRFFDLVKGGKDLENKLRDNYKFYKKILERIYDFGVFVPDGGKYGAPLVEVTEEGFVETYTCLGQVLKKYLVDVSREVASALAYGENVLFEGSQGIGLDTTYGDYPKVTSSNIGPAAIAVSVGLPLKSLNGMESIGVVKAYLSKVGSGPVPTCLDGGRWPVDENYSTEMAKMIRKDGKEFGATTKRSRRIGWLDLVMLKEYCELCGFTQLAVTKLDVLADKGELCMAVNYKIDEDFSAGLLYDAYDLEKLSKARPIYLHNSGFSSKELEGVTEVEDLPESAKQYLEDIASFSGVPVTFVSLGPERKQTLYKDFRAF